MVLSESCCFFVSPLRVHTRRAKASPDTYKHKLHSAHTHTHTHTKIDFVPLTGDGKYDDSLRQGGDERSRYHRRREREELSVFYSCHAPVSGSERNPQAPSTPITHRHTRAHTHTSLIISDKAHQLTRLIKLVMLNFDPVRTFKDTSM